MKVLLYFNAVLAAFGAVMTVVLGVVCLLFGLYRDAAPQIGRGFPSLLLVTAAFVLLMAASGTATVGVWRRRRWFWLAQAALIVLIPVAAGMVWSGVQSR